MFDVAQVTANRRSNSKFNIKTRSADKILIRVKRPYTEKFKKSLAYSGPKKWNLLPSNLQNTPIKYKFKALASGWVNQKAVVNTSLSDTLFQVCTYANLQSWVFCWGPVVCMYYYIICVILYKCITLFHFLTVLILILTFSDVLNCLVILN